MSSFFESLTNRKSRFLIATYPIRRKMVLHVIFPELGNRKKTISNLFPFFFLPQKLGEPLTR
jgi:hypothetical protein